MRFRKTLGIGVLLYVTSYLAVSTHVLFDYSQYNAPRIEKEVKEGKQPVQLEVHKYTLNINGREKFLTLAGEVHFYNKTEHEIAQKLVKDHNYFADECGACNYDMTFGDKIFFKSVSFPSRIANSYYVMATGRSYETISDIAYKGGHEIMALEHEDPLKNMPLKDKIAFITSSWQDALLAPYTYYFLKEEEPFSAEEFEGISFKKSLIDDRDKNMALGIIEILSREEVDNLLANVGIGHLEGVISELELKVGLKELK